jgi:SMP-30/gluconolaconase/LRE-like protein
MKIRLPLFSLVLIFAALFCSAARAADDCAPSGKLQFVCGPSHAEDLVLVPRTHWIVASGAHLYLINADAKTWKEAYPGEEPRANQDKAKYADCPGAPDPQKLTTVGLSIRSTGAGKSTLLAVGKGGRDAIEAFQVDSASAEPTITWVGCVMMPKGTNSNAVTALPDGGFLVTSNIEAGHTRVEAFSGQISGAVYEWHPSSAIQKVAGTELSGDNGIESSPDGKQFWVNATGGRSVTRFTRTGDGLKTDKVDLDVGPDNIRWGQNGLLYVAGRADEPACGGTLAARDGKLDSDCLRGFEILTLNPKTMKTQPVIRTQPDPNFNGWSTGLQLGKELWIPCTRCDRIGYMSLK